MSTLATTTQERLMLPGAAPVDPAAGGGFSLRDYWSIIRQRMVTIVLLWMLFAAVAIGIWILVWFKFPTYSSEALVECIADKPDEAMSLTGSEPPKDAYERFIEGQARLMKSPDVLDLALQTPEVLATDWYKTTRADIRRLELEDQLHSGFVRGTNFVQVKMGCRDPKDPRIIVDQVVRAFLSKVSEEGVSPYESKLRGAKTERDKLELLINSKRQDLRDFAANTLDPGALAENAGPSPLATQLNLYSEQEATLQAQLNEIKPIYDLYNDPNRPVDFGEELAMVESDPQVAALASQKMQLEQIRELRGSQYGVNHREYKNLQAQWEVVDKNLTQFREQRLNELITYKKEQISTAYLNTLQQLLAAREQRESASALQRDQDRALITYQTKIEDLEWLMTRFEELNRFVMDLEGVVTQKSAIRHQIAQRPVDPIERSSPSVLLLPAGIFVAFLAAVGIAVLSNLMDTSVRTPQDIARHVNVPLLGAIPDVDDEEVPIERIETAVRDAPQSMVAEAFRTVRTNLQFSAPADRQRTVIITSPQPEDGKTTVACNLAVSVALAGRRVLLVDANFRRPAVHKFFTGVGGKIGLSNILVGEGTLSECVRKTDLPSLDVLNTGPIPPNPAELLSSPQMRDFLDEAGRTYDQVFLDLPPVLLANDVVVLSSLVDGLILVVRARQNSRGVAQRTVRQLLRVNAHIFGAVLNAVQVQRGGYFREQLRTFYDYPEQTSESGSGSKKLPAK